MERVIILKESVQLAIINKNRPEIKKRYSLGPFFFIEMWARNIFYLA